MNTINDVNDIGIIKLFDTSDRASIVYEKMDWAILINKLRKSGVTYDHIQQITGMSASRAYKIQSDRVSTETLDIACSLMQLYRDAVRETFPVVGDHHEFKHMKDN